MGVRIHLVLGWEEEWDYFLGSLLGNSSILPRCNMGYSVLLKEHSSFFCTSSHIHPDVISILSTHNSLTLHLGAASIWILFIDVSNCLGAAATEDRPLAYLPCSPGYHPQSFMEPVMMMYDP